MGRRRAAAFVCCLVLLGAAAGCGRDRDGRAAADLRALAAGTPPWVGSDKVSRQLWDIERSFYEARQHRPAWIANGGTTPQLIDLVQQLKLSEQHGLDPAAYGTGDFAREIDASTGRWLGTRFADARVAELDARLTHAYLRYAADLLGWTTSPRAVRADWVARPQKADLAGALEEAVTSTDVRRTLEALAPTHSQYQGLKAALAVERAPERAARIRMNMERWRWAPRDLGPRYILINVPAYQMQVIEGDRPALAMRVIVGAPETPTPLFSDAMTYVVFSPYWNIPESILREETLPKMATDPGYLERNQIEVVKAGRVIDAEDVDWSDEKAVRALRFRQAPGPENALGLVKFIFPNHFSVYLHDTPSDALFNRDHRALSHGCIRVENPVGLAEYVLRDRPEWTADRIRAAMQADEEQTVRLKAPLQVHIGYWTAWVEPDGRTVAFTDDPYGIDAAQASATKNTGTAPVTARTRS